MKLSKWARGSRVARTYGRPPRELELATLRWFRDGWKAEGYERVRQRYTEKERFNAIQYVIEAGMGAADYDVDERDNLSSIDADLNTHGRNRLLDLEAQSIVRGRRLDRVRGIARFVKEYKGVLTFLGGAVIGSVATKIFKLLMECARR